MYMATVYQQIHYCVYQHRISCQQLPKFSSTRNREQWSERHLGNDSKQPPIIFHTCVLTVCMNIEHSVTRSTFELIPNTHTGKICAVLRLFIFTLLLTPRDLYLSTSSHVNMNLKQNSEFRINRLTVLQIDSPIVSVACRNV